MSYILYEMKHYKMSRQLRHPPHPVGSKCVHRYKESDFLYIDECVIVEIVFSAKIDINGID